jgi:hypothetical protein
MTDPLTVGMVGYRFTGRAEPNELQTIPDGIERYKNRNGFS